MEIYSFFEENVVVCPEKGKRFCGLIRGETCETCNLMRVTKTRNLELARLETGEITTGRQWLWRTKLRQKAHV